MPLSEEDRDGAYFEVRLASERVVVEDIGRMVELLVDVPEEKCPKSSMCGLRDPEDVEASLKRTRDDWGVWGRCLDEDDGRDSSYNVEESSVETEVLGEPGRRSKPCSS